MRYTLWHRDVLIGETDFGLGRRAGSRAGVFHPTPSGMAVLPALTAMGPALLAAGRAMSQAGIGGVDAEQGNEISIEDFSSSPEGRRILEAAEQMADLELRDDRGRPVPCESMLVSDLQEMVALGAELRVGKPLGRDPIRYIISATFPGGQLTGLPASRGWS